MDRIGQSSLKNWLIGALVVLNLVTLSTIWVQRASNPSRPPDVPPGQQQDAVPLLRKVLDLDQQQAFRAESVMTAWRGRSKGVNDLAADLKQRLAEELFKETPDTTVAHTLAVQIGDLQAEVEILRFQHFLALSTVCTPEQRAKLRPMVINAFARKPPRDEHIEGPRVENARQQKPVNEEQLLERREGRPGPSSPDATRKSVERPRDGTQPGPPSIEEKLSKYAERLNLSDKQIAQVREILTHSRKKGEAGRMGDPGKGTSREEIKREEDRRVKEVLDPVQVREFERMLSKRREREP